MFISATSTGLSTAAKLDERAVAENLARNQIEDIRNQSYNYDNLYPTTLSFPPGYTATINVEDVSPIEYTSSLQKVQVSVFHGDKVVLELETYKANR